MPELIITKDIDAPGMDTLDGYRQHGGYQALARALKEYQPDELVDMVKKSGLRGRGGAGFPTGMKWSFLARNDKLRYLCCNADESEPGTFKDRMIMEKNPHQLVEGVIITSYACRVSVAFIYVRGELALAGRQVERAVEEAYAAGYIGKNILGSGFNLDVIVHHGAGAYICGEETALMESLEGKRGYPRLKPPFPAAYGVFGCPTTINNVETLANVPFIVERGASWFASIGRERNSGPKLYCVSGHVKRPGIYETPLGVAWEELLNEYCGGMKDPARPLKAVIPGGSSVPVMTAAEMQGTIMDFD